jgi:hypothetical protein
MNKENQKLLSSLGEHSKHEVDFFNESDTWNCFKSWAMLASSDENMTHVKKIRHKIPMPHKIAWPPKDYDMKKPYLRRYKRRLN